jgi:hypothetical protein
LILLAARKHNHLNTLLATAGGMVIVFVLFIFPIAIIGTAILQKAFGIDTPSGLLAHFLNLPVSRAIELSLILVWPVSLIAVGYWLAKR